MQAPLQVHKMKSTHDPRMSLLLFFCRICAALISGGGNRVAFELSIYGPGRWCSDSYRARPALFSHEKCGVTKPDKVRIQSFVRFSIQKAPNSLLVTSGTTACRTCRIRLRVQYLRGVLRVLDSNSNIVRRRPAKNRTPTADELAYYVPMLLEEIRLVDPDIIVTLGEHFSPCALRQMCITSCADCEFVLKCCQVTQPSKSRAGQSAVRV